MAKYKFEQFNLEIVDPEIRIHGSVGTRFEDGKPMQVTFAQVKLITTNAEFGVELKDSSTPASWSVEDLQSWVTLQLEKYKISEQ